MLITTIIPTLCEEGRKASLLRAIESVHRASQHPVKLVVVANGQRINANLLAILKSRNDIQVLQIAESSLTKAHLAGRQLVSTEYFSFLDDDDEYLPGALDARLAYMIDDTAVDVVVTNGFANTSGNDRLLFSRLANVGANPLYELFQENWLHNCNHLFRSSSVPIHYFEDPHPYMEWTWLAFQLAIDQKKIVASESTTFRYNDTPGSLSKSSMFIASGIALYQRMLSRELQSEIQDIIRRQLSNAWHNFSAIELNSGSRTKAIQAHIRSLICHGSGLKYLPYTRHLLRKSPGKVSTGRGRDQ